MSDNQIQSAILALIESLGCWNAFDGPSIVRDLRANRILWRTALVVGARSQVYFEGGTFEKEERDFSAHRGLPDTLYGFDTLQLTPVIGQEDNLKSLAARWGADEIQWYGLNNAQSAVDNEAAYVLESGDPERVVLEVWWD